MPDVEFPAEQDDWKEAVQEALTECNGFLYHGDRLEGQIALIKWLRNNWDKGHFIITSY